MLLGRNELPPAQNSEPFDRTQVRIVTTCADPEHYLTTQPINSAFSTSLVVLLGLYCLSLATVSSVTVCKEDSEDFEKKAKVGAACEARLLRRRGTQSPARSLEGIDQRLLREPLDNWLDHPSQAQGHVARQRNCSTLHAHITSPLRDSPVGI